MNTDNLAHQFITIPRIKWMVACVEFQCFGKGLQDNTSKKVCVMLPWKCGYCKSFLGIGT